MVAQSVRAFAKQRKVGCSNLSRDRPKVAKTKKESSTAKGWAISVNVIGDDHYKWISRVAQMFLKSKINNILHNPLLSKVQNKLQPMVQLQCIWYLLYSA